MCRGVPSFLLFSIHGRDHAFKGYGSVTLTYEVFHDSPVDGCIGPQADPVTTPVGGQEKPTVFQECGGFCGTEVKSDGGTTIHELEGGKRSGPRPKIRMAPGGSFAGFRKGKTDLAQSCQGLFSGIHIRSPGVWHNSGM